jgi:predicted AAA+ superfamily ATPase
MLEDNFQIVNKGNIAELYVGLELLKNQSCYTKKDLYYWQRDAKNSQAEIDYVIQKNESILPIEVKAGTKGAMQSMHIFLTEKRSTLGIRVSLENFGKLDNIQIMPLYAINQIINL